jgi:hypothetical protein
MDTPLYRGEIYKSILFSVLQQKKKRERNLTLWSKLESLLTYCAAYNNDKTTIGN